MLNAGPDPGNEQDEGKNEKQYGNAQRDEPAAPHGRFFGILFHFIPPKKSNPNPIVTEKVPKKGFFSGKSVLSCARFGGSINE